MGLQTETKADFVYDRTAPWDGIGHNVTKAKTSKDLIKLAGLDWSVEKMPIQCGGKDIPDHFALRRSSDKSILDIVGSRYIPAQHTEAFAFLDAFVRKGKGNFATAGSLDKGRVVWGLADLHVDFTLPGGDKVKGYLFLGVPHMQGRSLIARVTTIRDACNNTLSIALRTSKRHGIGDVFRMNHRNKFDEAQMIKARDTLDLARTQVEDFGDQARRLTKVKLSRNDAIKVLQPIFQPNDHYRTLIDDADNIGKKMAAILEANTKAPGAQPNNAWGLLNAVTYWADHMASRTQDKRLANAFVGRTMKQKEAVLTSLLELA